MWSTRADPTNLTPPRRIKGKFILVIFSVFVFSILLIFLYCIILYYYLPHTGANCCQQSAAALCKQLKIEFVIVQLGRFYSTNARFSSIFSVLPASWRFTGVCFFWKVFPWDQTDTVTKVGGHDMDGFLYIFKGGV